MYVKLLTMIAYPLNIKSKFTKNLKFFYIVAFSSSKRHILYHNLNFLNFQLILSAQIHIIIKRVRGGNFEK
jgi:hypothetical protein